MLLDLVNRINSERKVKKNLDIQVWVLWRSSRGRPESTSQGRPLNVRLRRPLDVISGRQIGTSRGRPDLTSRSNGIFKGRPGDQYLPTGNSISWRFKLKFKKEIHSNLLILLICKWKLLNICAEISQFNSTL